MDRRHHFAAAFEDDLVEDVALAGEVLVQRALGGLGEPRNLQCRRRRVALGHEHFARGRENRLTADFGGGSGGPRSIVHPMSPQAVAESGTDGFQTLGKPCYGSV